MKKKMIIVVCIVLVIAVAVIAGSMMFGGSHAGIDNNPEAEVTGDSKVLVAYFSWSGNGQQMAQWIAEETGGELFRIVPTESYGEDYNACADRAKEELDNEIRPELAAHIDVDAMAQYDVIYLGFPVWWYDLPMSVWAFLEEYDLSGKTIVPFFSHNGSSNGANSLNRISELAAGATVLSDEALSIRGSSVSNSEEKIKEWAREWEPDNSASSDETVAEGKTLVVYYSASGRTEAVAGYIADATDGDTFELIPVEPYSSDDLDWTDRDSRVSLEHADPDSRAVPLNASTVENWEEYDTVFIGYPIWWGIAAWPVDEFISANDFTGKTVIPFCTSSTSGLGESGELLAEAAGTGNWLTGERFRSGVSEDTVLAWLEGLGL